MPPKPSLADGALETAGGFSDGTGVLGMALQLAGLGASSYQAVSDSDATATITSYENAQNTLKQQADVNTKLRISYVCRF